MNNLDEFGDMSTADFFDKLESDSTFQDKVKKTLSENEKLVEELNTILGTIASSYFRFQKEYFPKIAAGLSVLFGAISKLAASATEYHELAKKFSEIIYKAHWFHCSYFSFATEFETNIIDCYKKNCDSENITNLIDNLFFDFYDTKLDEIIEMIEDTDSNSDRVTLIKQAISAYRRNEFYLTITALITVFDRLVYERTSIPEWHNQKKLLESFQKLAERNKRTLAFIACSHYEEQVKNEVYASNNISAMLPITGIPNRHMITHGFQFNYATKKTALNSIIMISVLYCLPELNKNANFN